MELLRDFLNDSNIDTLWETDSDIIVWVDWREEDDAIVRYCEEVLQTHKLSAECQDADNKLGYILTIRYDDKKEIVPFNPDDVSRDATLITLNQILRPDYEVRLWMDSIGGDTLAFVPLSSAQWSQLENEFGEEKVQYHFSKVNEHSRMFDLSMDEISEIVKERGL